MSVRALGYRTHQERADQEFLPCIRSIIDIYTSSHAGQYATAQSGSRGVPATASPFAYTRPDPSGSWMTKAEAAAASEDRPYYTREVA
jgi:hypothetical protein